VAPITIRDLQRFVDALWDWGILDGCFGNTRIKPTDIDGLVERNGQFLLLEAKGPNAPIPYGQEITFKNLLKTGIFTVIVIWGNPGKPEHMQIYRPDCPAKKREAGLADLRRVVSEWYRCADSFRANA
jgi:hypothetical protein